MAHNWLSLIREEIGCIHEVNLPLEVLRLANDDQLIVDDNFKVSSLSEDAENWLNSLQREIWPPGIKRPKSLLVYVGLYRVEYKAKLYKDSNEILLGLLSNQKALRAMQRALDDQLDAQLTSSVTSSDSDSDDSDDLGQRADDEDCAEFIRAFRALAAREAANLGAEIDTEEIVTPKTLTIIELPAALAAMNTVWWRCVVDNSSGKLVSAWLLEDHAQANVLAQDENRRARFSAQLREYIARTHSKYKLIFNECSTKPVTILVDVLQVADDNDKLWTVGVEKAPAEIGAQIEDQSNGPLQLAPVRSVYELLFNR